MGELRVYDALSRVRPLSYRGKIMLVAFVGTHVPLLALIVAFVAWLDLDRGTALAVIGTALAATLAGTGLTLFLLDRLLRPILLTSRALRRYTLHREPPRLPTTYTDDAGTLMADTVASLSRLERAFDRLANQDAATGLPNREGFARILALRLGAGAPSLAICGLRLANLRALAGGFDRAIADAFVRAVAGRLEAALPPGTGLARVEDDRLAFCLPAGDDPDAVAAEVERVVAAVGADVVAGDARITPEIGAAVTLAPADGDRPEALLDNLGAALADAAPARPAAPRFYAPGARAAARERFVLRQELRRAAAEGRLLLDFQPIVDAGVEHGPRVVGAEALVRWRHPTRGVMAPGLFIPIAEQSEAIDEIGVWVLREACAQASAWQSAGLEGVAVAVNLSVRQLRDRRLVAEVADALDAHGLRPDLLELELTESAALEDVDRTRACFGELRALGVRLAIDDFGAGHSNLSHLRNLPFDRLKIDREFVADVGRRPSSRAICRALIELAGGLGIGVLGEGVETSDELETLRRDGCRIFQGFHFSRPLPAADFLRHARRGGGDRPPGSATAA